LTIFLRTYSCPGPALKYLSHNHVNAFHGALSKVSIQFKSAVNREGALFSQRAVAKLFFKFETMYLTHSTVARAPTTLGRKQINSLQSRKVLGRALKWGRAAGEDREVPTQGLGLASGLGTCRSPTGSTSEIFGRPRP